ncbi:hypothetical protein PS732_02661 [Pseudomonas fluorescens]|uniref:Uncharacterized protein n=1 Tax=Pseudomonas fluorescens TaxID=294 RepID=A0ABD7VGR2_PSEFL|nr:hypothetical protein PS732_02661 [Pseudomonas fluorescens]
MGQKSQSQSQSKITNQIKSPLTLALSRRERELIEVFGSATPTWDTESNCSGLMKPDTHLGENARQIEVSDDQTTSFLFR